MPTSPQSIALLPDPPTTDNPVDFDPRADASLLAQQAMVPQLNMVNQVTYQNSVESFNSANSAREQADRAELFAQAASSAANVTEWVPNITYERGKTVWSPLSFLNYRRRSTGASATDPRNDSVNWTLQQSWFGRGGVENVTTDLTLTNTTGSAVSVKPSEPGYYAIAPSPATLADWSGLYYMFNNTGDFAYGFKDFAGNTLGWTPPGTSRGVGFANEWLTNNLSKVAITAEFNSPSMVPLVFKKITLDTKRTLLLLSNIHGVIYNKDWRTWGTPVYMVGDSEVLATRYAADKVAIVTRISSGMKVAIWSTIGVSFVRLAAVDKVELPITRLDEIIAIGNIIVIVYTRTENGSDAKAFQVVDLSSGTPVYSTSIQITADTLSGFYVFASGSVVRVVYAVNGVILCYPYTLTGTSLVQGTRAITTQVSNGQLRAFQMTSGDIFALLSASSGMRGAIFKLTGSTENVSQVDIFSGLLPSINVDYSEIQAGKIAVSTTILGTLFTNTVVNTAGTISVGTPLSLAQNVDTWTMMANDGLTGRLVFTTSAGTGIASINYTVASPSLIKFSRHNNVNLPNKFASTGPDGQVLKAGNSTYKFGGTQAFDCRVVNGKVQPIEPLTVLPAQAIPGSSPSESWVLETMGAVGISVKLIEAAP